MAFFLSTNGHLHAYFFKYLGGAFEKARMERTVVHSENQFPSSLPNGQKDFYAIDVMASPVFTLSPDALLDQVKDLMKDKNVRHVPIVEGRKIVGLISDRDILKVDLSGAFHYLKAADVMSKVLVVALDETPIAHIARVLMEEKISCLPVIDKDHHLVGMISRTDILRTVVYNRLVLK